MTHNIHLELHHPILSVKATLPGSGITAVVGASGAGKTTLLRCIAGLESAAAGLVNVNGVSWQDDARRIRLPTYQRKVGLVFQEASLFPHLSVQANLEFGLRRTAQRTISLTPAVDLLGLAQLLKRSPTTLSGGEKQRVSIARALATSPDLLLMDEPLASLDESRKAEVLAYLDRLSNELSLPILYVSHAMSEVAHLAQQVLVLEGGKVFAQADVFEILSRADLPYAHGDHAFALVAARMASYDAHYQLSQFDFAGGSIFLPQSRDSVLDMNTEVRLRIQARDVSLSLVPQHGSSILNTIPVKIAQINQDSAGLFMLELDAAGVRLLARITQKSLDQLGLQVGLAVFAQIKGVAVLR